MSELNDSLQTLTKSELVALAQSEYGAEIQEYHSKDEIIRRIEALEYERSDHPIEQEAERQSQAESTNTSTGKDYQEITVHESPAPGGDEPVTIGVNGYHYELKRNERQAVPTPVVDILQNAIETRMHMVNNKMVKRDTPRFAITVHNKS